MKIQLNYSLACSSTRCSAVVLLFTSVFASSSILANILFAFLTSFANKTQFFSTCCACSKLVGFSNEFVVIFSASSIQGIRRALRPKCRNQIKIGNFLKFTIVKFTFSYHVICKFHWVHCFDIGCIISKSTFTVGKHLTAFQDIIHSPKKSNIFSFSEFSFSQP